MGCTLSVMYDEFSFMCCTAFVLFVLGVFVFFFFKQKTAYEMRISDWSSDVCSSDLVEGDRQAGLAAAEIGPVQFVGRGCRAVARIGAEQPRLEIGRASCRERVCQYV